MKQFFSKLAIAGALVASSSIAFADQVSYKIEAKKEQVGLQSLTKYFSSGSVNLREFWSRNETTKIAETMHEYHPIEFEMKLASKFIQSEKTITKFIINKELEPEIFVWVYPRINQKGLLQTQVHVRVFDYRNSTTPDLENLTNVMQKFELNKILVLTDEQKTFLGQLNGINYYLTQSNIPEQKVELRTNSGMPIEEYIF